MENTKSQAVNIDQEEELSLTDLFMTFLRNWKWFLLSIVCFTALGVLYIIRQQPVYHREMVVLIKDQKGSSGGVAELAGTFSNLGLVSSNTKVNNELISFTSPAVMYEVVHRLGLNVSYSTPGTFHNVTLYGKTLPVVVTFPELDAQQGAGFNMTLNPDGTFTADEIYLFTPEGKEKAEGTVKGTTGFKSVKMPVLGNVTVAPNPQFAETLTKPMKIMIRRSGMQNAVETYSGILKGSRTDKDADAITLSINDVSIQRAVDVLNTVLAVYNENWVEDKNRLAVSTSKFIGERLKVIEQELGTVDADISQFKSEHLVPDLQEAARLSMKEDVDVSRDMLEVTNKLAMATYVGEYLANPENANNVIPVNTGVGNAQLEQQIANYNTMLLQRNTVAANSSDSNPLVIDYDSQLRGMREAIVRAVAAQESTLRTTLANMSGAKGTARQQLAQGPTQAKYLLSVERQQKVKEALYLYLLQKREENELTQTFTAYNTRVITPPMGSLLPVAPKKALILGVMVILGILVPGVIIYVATASDTKVRSRRDLESMSVPFAGEIPHIPGSKRMSVRKLLNHRTNKKLEEVLSVVKEGSRDVVSESFRIVRGNLDFMSNGNDKGAMVAIITSFNPGSGKSFISYNLPASFALKGKKVLVIDGDLRHGSVSQFVKMPGKGLSNYLNGNTDDWKNLIVPVNDHPNMYVMPIGHRPPNPSELLDNGRLGTLIDQLRSEFDYIFIDCPPVDVVVDTQIINRYTDRTIFVIRAGLLDRKSVAEVDQVYKDGRFHQMCIILNGTEYSNSHYHAYGSGYYHDSDNKGF